jgi:MFS transporter, ACS family, hexuronate transporter
LGGGALSDWLVRRGVHPPKARMYILSAVGLLAPLGAFVGVVPTAATAIAVTCFVAMLTQAWATTTAALCADLIPNHSTATVFGMMGMAGSLAGAFFAQLLGIVIQNFGYPAAFCLAAVLHPIAALILHFALRPSRTT